MGKTILERMYIVTQKMENPIVSGEIMINAATKKKAHAELGKKQRIYALRWR